MQAPKRDFSDLIKRGIARFPKGPPQDPVLVQMRDRVERLLAAESAAERDGVTSALILSIRMPSERTFLESEALQRAGEALIEAGSAFMRDPGSFSAQAELRGAFNTVQAVYCAEVRLEDHRPAPSVPEDDAPGF